MCPSGKARGTRAAAKDGSPGVRCQAMFRAGVGGTGAKTRVGACAQGGQSRPPGGMQAVRMCNDLP